MIRHLFSLAARSGFICYYPCPYMLCRFALTPDYAAAQAVAESFDR